LSNRCSFHTVYNRSITYSETSPQRFQRLPSAAFTSAPQWRLTSSAISSHVAKLMTIAVDPCSRSYAPSHGSSGPNSCPGIPHSHLPLHYAGRLSDRFTDGWRGVATRSTFSAYRSASLASKSSLTRPRHPPSCVVFIWPVLVLRRPCERMLMGSFPDASHHVDASIPPRRRRKCFLVTCVLTVIGPYCMLVAANSESAPDNGSSFQRTSSLFSGLHL
jgi:hypothetical protein